MRNKERAAMQAAAQNVGELLHLTQAEVRAYRAEVAAYRAEVEAGRAELLGEIRRIADSMGFIEVDVAEMLKQANIVPAAALPPPTLLRAKAGELDNKVSQFLAGTYTGEDCQRDGDHTVVDIEQFDG